MAFVAISIVLYIGQLSLYSLMILLFIFGCGASGFFTCFAMIRELFPLSLVATVLGIMNVFDSICEALFEPLVGAVLDLTWSGLVSNGVHIFSITSYHVSLLLLPLSLSISLVILFFVKETYCVHQL